MGPSIAANNASASGPYAYIVTPPSPNSLPSYSPTPFAPIAAMSSSSSSNTFCRSASEPKSPPVSRRSTITACSSAASAPEVACVVTGPFELAGRAAFELVHPAPIANATARARTDRANADLTAVHPSAQNARSGAWAQGPSPAQNNVREIGRYGAAAAPAGLAVLVGGVRCSDVGDRSGSGYRPTRPVLDALLVRHVRGAVADLVFQPMALASPSQRQSGCAPA